MTSQSDAPNHRSPGGPPRLDPVDDDALAWLLRLDAAKADPRVRAEFEAWRAGDPRHAAAFARVAGLWGSAELASAAGRQGGARGHGPVGLGTVRRGVGPAVRLDGTPVRRAGVWRRRLAAVAAALAIAVAAPELVRVVRDLGADHVTATGRQDRVVLPDGSTLVLNSDTAVGLDFAADRRTVRLIRGEAFLDVVRDPDRPFHVTGHFADVEVVGTAFAVRAGDTADDVVLQRGRLAVRPLAAAPAAAASVTLAPLQAVSVGAAGAGRVAAVDGDTAFAWLDGRLRFRDRPLGRVLDELRRYHRGVIIVADRRLEALRVSGNYRIDDPALVVASLADAVGARLTRLSDHVLILR